MCEYLSDNGWDGVSQPFVFTVLKKDGGTSAPDDDEMY